PALLASPDDLLVLHSFPTRRSSDLKADARGGLELLVGLPQQRGALGLFRAVVDQGAGGVLAAFHPLHIAGAHDGESLQHIHPALDRKSTRLNSSHVSISYAVFCLKK